MQARSQTAWDHLITVCRPALLVAPPSFLDDIRATLAAAGIQKAVARKDSAPIFDWLTALLQFQGISDANASAYAEKHGLLRWSDIAAALATKPSCGRL